MKSHTIPQREAERVADDLVGPPVDSPVARAYRPSPYHLIPNRANELAPVDEAKRDRGVSR